MQDYNVRFPAYDGGGRLYAEITKQELSGKWRVMDVDWSVLESFVRLCCIRTLVPEAWEADVMDLENAEMIPDEALTWKVVDGLLKRGAEVRLLRPLAKDAVTPYKWSSYRGEGFGLIAAICATFDHGGVWEWKGVFSWQESENAPGWVVKDMLIVLRGNWLH